MEKTLVILKPSTIQRNLIGEVISRFTNKGLRIIGMKMVQLEDAILDEHYAHLKEKPFFGKVKQSMKATPVVVLCLEGLEAARVVRNLIGSTNGREAMPGTIRGDFAMSTQENIVHASDSVESARIELKRFFAENEIYEYKQPLHSFLYAETEI